MSEAPRTDLPPGAEELGGRVYMRGTKGELLPIETVKEQHRLEDETVRTLHAAALAMSAAITAFKGRAFGDVDAFLQLLDERYQAQKRGEKGNLTLKTVDGLTRVQVQVADEITFGPELQTAKALVDELVGEWAATSNANLVGLVSNAFRLDKEGQINRGALLGLLRMEIEDDRWKRAMDAIRDAMRVTGSKRYIRFATRATPDAAWVNIPLDIAIA